MDPTTESIAHFIGLFELSVEELRLRQEYLVFTLKRAAEQEAPPMEAEGVRLQAPHDVGRYDPGLAYEPGAHELAPVENAPDAAWDAPDVPAPPSLEPDGPDEPSHDVGVVEILPPFSFLLGTPGSVVSVTLQVATLSDNDLFLSGLDASFTDPVALQEMLGGIVALADALAAFDVPELPQDSDWIGFAEDMLAQIGETPASETLAEVTTLHGQDAEGIFVDGVIAAEAPVWTDLLPLYLQPEEAAEEKPEASAALGAVTDGETVAQSSDGIGQGGRAWSPAEHDFARDFGDDAPNLYSLEPGHQIVAGANTAINEIALGSQWIDAPVIVVRGDVAKFDAISQVNVLVEHDTVDGVAAGQKSLAHNVAEITTESSEDPAAPPPDDVLPSGWQVVRVEADLLQVNWVKQFTYATDFDRAEVTFSGQATFLGLGENEIVNAAVLNEFGHHYDLIFVAGDMVDASVVSQKNILFDSDEITTRDHGEPEAAAAAAQVAREAHGSAAGTQPGRQEPGLEDRNLPEPEVAPAAAPDALAPAADEFGDAEPPAAAPAMSLADNLLFNQATLKTTGVDTFAEMTEAFAATAESLAEGAETIAREVAEDALFAGKEALRVLQIDGDLAKLNLFEQTNIVGDADQIRLEMQALRDRFEAEMKLIAGSNALVNLATATEYGVDSTVMAGGQVYDDALIHQAELFDVDAAPNGVAMSALANEAVAAFLSDDMLKATEVTNAIAPTEDYGSSPQLDVMQTALA